MAKASVKRKKVTIRFEGEPGRTVMVTGSFNDWVVDPADRSSKQMKEKDEGHYSINMFLPVGEHEYKFFSDGDWFVDQQSEDQKLNQFGTLNSVITVG